MKIQTYQQLYAYCQEQKDALIEALTEAIGLALLLDDGYQRQFCAATFDDLDPALQKEVISKYLSETCDDDDRIRYAPNAVYEESMKWLEKESKVRDKINKGFERKE